MKPSYSGFTASGSSSAPPPPPSHTGYAATGPSSTHPAPPPASQPAPQYTGHHSPAQTFFHHMFRYLTIPRLITLILAV
eukprot:7233113-Pyramimonas_sp.AAC.1